MYQIVKKLKGNNKKIDDGKEISGGENEEKIEEGEVKESYLDKLVRISVFELLDLLYADDDEKQFKKNFVEDLISDRFGKDKLREILDDFYKKKSEEMR